jgi:predicted ribosome quality control (RQC) complex YloA/Tae2 family protein
MKIVVNTTKSAYENVSLYFDRAKKAKAKLPAIAKVILDAQKKLALEQKELLEKKERIIQKEQQVASLQKRKEQWFEKFRWFYTSNGLLVIGGRDADTNEMVIKKHVEPTDIIFHTEMAGSPFFVLKTKTDVEPQILEEIAQITAVYSRAWKAEYASTTVFWVRPDQVSKHANSGEFMGKGSFMIRGEKHFLHPRVELYIGQDEEGAVIIGTSRSIKTRAIPNSTLKIVQGREKPSAIAKEIKKKMVHQTVGVHVDEIIKILPSGGCRISK